MSFTQQKEDKEIEEALVRDFQAGILGAYDKIAELYQQKIYALSFNLVRNQMDAQDVTQEVLLTLQKGGTIGGVAQELVRISKAYATVTGRHGSRLPGEDV